MNRRSSDRADPGSAAVVGGHRAERRGWPPPTVWVSPAVLLGIAVLWEVAVSSGVLDRRMFSAPTDIVGIALEAVQSGRLWTDVYATFAGLLIGVGAALVVGLVLGLMIGRLKRFRWLFEWQLLILDSLPRVTIAPLILVTVGLGMPAKYWIAFLSAFVPVALFVATAARAVPTQYFDVSKAFGLSRVSILRKAIVPGVIPHMFLGLQLGATRALLAVVVTEMFNPKDGLGRWISFGLNSLDPAQMFFAAVLVAVGGAVLVQALSRVEGYVVRWQ